MTHKGSDDWGEQGPNTSPGMAELWAKAQAADSERSVPGGRWLPWRAVEVDDGLLPRERIDDATVKRYAEAFAELPPIKVERGRLRLIGGRHRLAAAVEVSDIIPAVEVDADDDEALREAAWLDNAEHGREYTQAERIKMARYLLLRHHPDGPEPTKWPIARIAALSGVSRSVIFKWLAGKREAEHGDSPDAGTTVHRGRLASHMDNPDDTQDAAGTPASGGASVPASTPKRDATRTPRDDRNGHGGNGASPKASGHGTSNGQRQMQVFDTLAAFMAMSPREIAETVRPEDRRGQAKEAARYAEWFQEYGLELETLDAAERNEQRAGARR